METRHSALAATVRQYLAHCRPLSSAERAPFKAYPFPTALRKAALALTPNGKRFPHQRRLTRKSLRAAYSHLQKIAPKLRRTRTVDALHTLITQHTQIPGIGELYRYDTALRLGAHLRLHPTRVYLHAGTRTGARNLGLDHKQPSLPRSAFPPPLRTLPASALEDLLCIYKHQLRR
ncbi:MAG: hypothetical protein ACTHN5_13020 [Phycisphaerae bacterium]